MLVTPTKTSHWYLPTGECYYEIAKKDGSGMRPTTIRDARKVKAVPSVTNILSILGKPGLESWKQEQAILSALTLPKKNNEELTDFAKRVVSDMGEEAKAAAETGTKLHDAAEAYASNRLLPDDSLLPLFTPFKQWYDEHVKEARLTEKVVVSQNHGYAGRLDLLAVMKDKTFAVVDIKTQGNASDKFTVYPEWPMQLAAYAHAVDEDTIYENMAIINVVIGRDKPDIYVVEHDNADKHFAAFLNVLNLWKYLKDYDPCQL